MTNKVTFGIKNVHYAVKNPDGTYKTPVAFPGAVSMTNAAKGDLTEFYADDIQYYTTSTNQGYDGTFDFAYAHDQFLIDVMGYTLSSDGVLSENANARISEVALLFEFDADVKAVRRCLPHVKFSRSNFDSTTKTTSSDPNTSQLTYTASGGENGVPQYKTTATTDESIYDAWYTTVYGGTLETPPVPGP